MIDSHAHLNHEDFINDIPLYIEESKKEGVNYFLCVGWDLKSSIDAVNIANKYKEVYAAVGIHPNDIKLMNDDDFNKIELLLSNKKVIAIGEIGLDFHYDKDINIQNQQIEWFIKFINLANKYNLPVVIHSRDAIDSTYQILLKNKVNKGGIIHCYSANKYYVDKYVDLGFYFGIGGVVTFKNAKTLVEAVDVMPLDRILLETDCPYMAPVPFRGQTNHSKYLKYIANKIAEIKKVSIEEISKKANKNFINLMGVEL